MFGFVRGLTGWKLYVLIGTGAFAAGIASGIRWEKGGQADDLEARIAALSEQAQAALVSLGDAWEEEAAQAQLDVNEWRLQNESDQALLLELLAGQTELRNLFDELDSEITVVTDFGTCQLSADAVRLLRAASERARATEVSDD